VKLKKNAAFVGRAALEAIKAAGPDRRLVGFRCLERAIPRQGYEVFLEDRQVDVVRSGGFSPSLQVGIGTTFLPTDSAAPGTMVELGIRGKRVPAEVVKMPFYTGGSVRKA
jgi:aminomethyltransferase